MVKNEEIGRNPLRAEPLWYIVPFASSQAMQPLSDPSVGCDISHVDVSIT